MEPLWILLGLAVVFGPWILAGVALARSRRAESRTTALESELRVLAARLAMVQARPGSVPSATPSSRASVPLAEAATRERPPSEAVLATTLASPSPPSAERPVPATAPGPAAAPSRPPAAAAVASAPPGTLEERIALVWLTRIGALVVLLGAATFFKYAVDNDWIGPTGRVALGVLAGVAALVAGEALRARTRALWVNVLQGAGVAVLFFSAFAAATLYRLVPDPAAFAAVAVVAAAGCGLALRGRSEVVLALSLLGGLLAPVFLSTGEDRPVALLAWLLLASGAALAVSARLGFRVVPWIALAGSAVLFGGWYDRFFDVHAPPPLFDPDRPARVQQGAYFALSVRALPFLLALAHVGAWLAAWERFRPRLESAGRPAARDGAWPRPLADGWLGVVLAALNALAFAFLHDRPLAAGAALALAGVAAALLSSRARRPAFHPIAAALGGLLLAAALRHGGASIAAAALWAVATLASAARSLLGRTGDAGAPGPAPTVLAAALGGLGFAGLSLVATRTDQQLLRAALVGAGAVAELALGAILLRRAPREAAPGGPGAPRALATVLLGSALGLVAAALAFLLSGASMTVAWAALGAAVAVVAARERDPFWLAGGLALLALALVRGLAVDLPAPENARLAFLASSGAEGAFRARILVNERGAAFLGLAAALLVAARAVLRVPSWRVVAGTLATAAHGALLLLAVTEARAAVLALPAPPSPGDALAFESFRSAVWTTVAAQAGALDTTTTVVMGLYAVALVGMGFVAREVLHRWLGLALFATTLAKVMLSDVWRLGRGQQILVFMAVGALMLAAGFLYARYGRRILGLPRPPPGAGALLALVTAGLGLGAPGLALALDEAPFRTVRPVEGVSAPGLHAIAVDAPLWQASLAEPGTLADVRIAGPDGAEVRWALRRVAGQDPETEVQGTLVDPVALPQGALRAVLDKGRAGLRTDELRLDLEGDDFLRPVRVESSDDGRRWGVLSEGSRVYAVRDVTGARRTTVLHPPSDARWLRVTVLPGGGEIRRISAAHPYRRAAVPPPVGELSLSASARTAGPDGRTSLFDLDLGAPGVPVDAVVLVTDAGAFERRVRVLASADALTWTDVGGGLLFRVPGDEELRVAIRPAGRRHLRVSVTDGDAPPLTLRAVRVQWPAHELVIDATAAGPQRLYAGAPGLRAPAYDLAAVLARTPGAPVVAARLGPGAANPAYAPAEAPVPFTERHRVALGVALGLVLLGVGAFAFRLLRAAA